MPMKLTERYFINVKAYKDAAAEIEGEYTRAMESADRFKGSEGYKDLKKQATAARDAALKVEKEKAGKAFREITTAMREAVTSRKITAPTPEQLAILQAFKMRGSLTADEIRQAANNMRGCPLALSVLGDIASGLGLTVHVDTGELSPAYLMKRIESLEYNAAAMLRGDSISTNRKPETEAECLTRWGSFGYELENVGGNLVNRGKINQPLIDAFSAAVNGEGAEV